MVVVVWWWCGVGVDVCLFVEGEWMVVWRVERLGRLGVDVMLLTGVKRKEAGTKIGGKGGVFISQRAWL